MKFTGKNLEVVRQALDLVDDELHNQIATCPDVRLFAEDLAKIWAEKAVIQNLKARIDRALAGAVRK